MNSERIFFQSKKTSEHVTYIMSSSFRILDNYGLFYALENYDSIDIVVLNRTAGKRHDDFMTSFLEDLTIKLQQFGSTSIMNDISNLDINNDIILDKGYLEEELLIEEYLVEKSSYGVTIIEGNVLVPVRIVSDKEEYSARTIRPKIHKYMTQFIDPVLEDYQYSHFEHKALEKFQSFLEEKLRNYHLRNHPEYDYTSGMSVFLKYGIISPVRMLLMMETLGSINKDVFIEELIVRRELSFNFVFYNKGYNDFHKLTYDWAYKTMNNHIFDKREYLYTKENYISFTTHDKYFNTAMKEMVHLGRMHGYMRMYWCKKIIEWSPSYEYAYKVAIELNNTYFLDGNTPNGYTGVAWCFGKHDRAWAARNIFGKLRYMNENGLKRKFDIEAYIDRIEKEVTHYESSKTKRLY